MSVVKCPTNCEHDYLFPHSIITHNRPVTVRGECLREVSEFVVCRACSHWIDGNYADCRCSFKCHEEPGGTMVEIMALDTVD